MSQQESNMDLVDFLEKEEVRQSLQVLIEKLPALVDAILSLEKVLAVGTAVTADKQTIDPFVKKAEALNINLETIESLLELIEKLPTLMKWLNKAEELGLFVEAVLKDEQSLADITNSVKELVEPAKHGMSFVQEVKEEAEKRNESISILTMMRWLKDPTVQKYLSYVQAFLTVSAKRV